MGIFSSLIYYHVWKELPSSPEEASRIFSKDHPHKSDEVTKEILTTNLKPIQWVVTPVGPQCTHIWDRSQEF